LTSTAGVINPFFGENSAKEGNCKRVLEASESVGGYLQSLSLAEYPPKKGNCEGVRAGKVCKVKNKYYLLLGKIVLYNYDKVSDWYTSE
jgi:hypothetical protein